MAGQGDSTVDKTNCTPEDGALAPALQSALFITTRPRAASDATSMRRKMAITRQRQGHVATSGSPHSGAAPSCRGAAFACVVAAPVLLWCRPTCHPVGKSGVAVVRRRGGADGRTSTSLIGATLAMDSAAPLFLAHRPACLPIGESICAIVWVCWCNWQNWHGRWLNRHGRWNHWHVRASTMMNAAAPRPLIRLPSALCIHCTVEGINRSRRSRCCGGSRWWRSGWRCRWRRWRWRGWCCGLRGECGGLSGGAPSAHGGAAELLLRW